jgi:hypothetical protein
MSNLLLVVFQVKAVMVVAALHKAEEMVLQIQVAVVVTQVVQV